MIQVGNCLHVMPAMEAESVDSIVTDPPYGLSFMGKEWDHGVPGVEFWKEALRVAKPGAHLVAFGGTRTFHRLVCAIEDAGWEIRDSLMWVYGSGFPKSLDVSKAIDKAAGAVREVTGRKSDPRYLSPATATSGSPLGNNAPRPNSVKNYEKSGFLTAPATDSAKQWDGWGTALKPAWEPIILARKPLSGTVAANVQEYGTGGLNIAGCRVGADPITQHGRKGSENLSMENPNYAEEAGREWVGRWPANVIHDGSAEVVSLFPVANSGGGSVSAEVLSRTGGPGTNCYGEYGRVPFHAYGDKGSTARFFYCAKASKKDREHGLDEFDATERVNGNKWTDQDYRVTNGERPANAESGPRKNIHPTVKPTDLMRWLVRLVTPPGGLVLDPFTGSGSTGKAAIAEGMEFVGIELSPEYAAIAKARCKAQQPGLAAA